MASYCLGFSLRKARFLRQLTGEKVKRLATSQSLQEGDTLYIWGQGHVPPGARRAQPVYVEDGFIRSAGLGAALAEPISWTFDRAGLHHRCDIETDLERLLANFEPGPELLSRAAMLRRRIVAGRLTKYNVGGDAWSPRAASRSEGAGEPILVVGQVADDAALASIHGPVRSNMELLKAVRSVHPNAHLVYKPHPDVVAGLREGRDENALAYADEVVESAHLDAVLPSVEAVHVMTSLTGFEALLRGGRVVCHAAPFYAGWGLTEDRLPVPRRSRALTLDQLVAGALIEYPRYRDPRTGEPCAAEEALAGLAARVARRGAIGERLSQGARTACARSILSIAAIGRAARRQARRA